MSYHEIDCSCRISILVLPSISQNLASLSALYHQPCRALLTLASVSLLGPYITLKGHLRLIYKMRYKNWDVLMFPGKYKIPVQEFKTSCHIVQDACKLTQIHTVLKTSRTLGCTLIQMQAATTLQFKTPWHFSLLWPPLCQHSAQATLSACQSTPGRLQSQASF